MPFLCVKTKDEHFNKRTDPVCEHNEQCVSVTVLVCEEKNTRMIYGGKEGNGIKSVVIIIRFEKQNNAVYMRTNHITAHQEEMA